MIKTQLRKYGNSVVILITPEQLKYSGLKESDWIEFHARKIPDPPRADDVVDEVIKESEIK